MTRDGAQSHPPLRRISRLSFDSNTGSNLRRLAQGRVVTVRSWSYYCKIASTINPARSSASVGIGYEAMNDSTDVAARLLQLGSATVHEALGRRGAIGPTIKPQWPGAAAAGPCRTVAVPAGDNLGIHLALESAVVGEMLVVGCPASAAFGFWGAILTEFAIARGVVALVASVGVRDVGAIEQLRFPVFAPTVSIQGTVKRDRGRHQVPVVVGQAVVRPGDWIVADRSGCVVVPAGELREAIEAAERKVVAEIEAVAAIRRGSTTREALRIRTR